MIEIDGSEAGGQILRTASALSALTQKPFKITNIRGARPQPGLKTQHMEGLRAVAQICGAEVKGLQLGSKEIEFTPKFIQEYGNIDINIETAGSIGLVLQSLSIISAGIDDHIHAYFKGGGTWNKWAPPVLYLQEVFNRFINIFAVEIKKDGFYPKGGAEVSLVLDSYKKKRINIPEPGNLKKIDVYSVATNHLTGNRVAERQAEEAKRLLENKFNVPITIIPEYTDSLSPGSGILIVAKTENSTFGADALGERGKSAENVAKEAVKNLILDIGRGSVDRHMADMLLPFIALSKGIIKTPQITQHIITNIEVIEKFLDVKFSIEGEKGEPGTITVI